MTLTETNGKELKQKTISGNRLLFQIFSKPTFSKTRIQILAIAVDEIEHTACFYEVKRQAKDVVIGIVKEKAEHFFQITGGFKKYNIEYKGLSMEDM